MELTGSLLEQRLAPVHGCMLFLLQTLSNLTTLRSGWQLSSDKVLNRSWAPIRCCTLYIGNISYVCSTESIHLKNRFQGLSVCDYWRFICAYILFCYIMPDIFMYTLLQLSKPNGSVQAIACRMPSSISWSIGTCIFHLITTKSICDYNFIM